MKTGRIHAKVGFISNKAIETKPGVFEYEMKENTYSGRLDQISPRYMPSADGSNSNIKPNYKFDFIADSYAFSNPHLIKYVEIRGVKWSVETYTPLYPRITLTLGEVYNEG